MGHWNVNHLTLDKFDQIKLFLLNKHGKHQVDFLLINETFLKTDMPDALYEVYGFSIYRKDRINKPGSGVMAFVNCNLDCKRRMDLESQNLEFLWLEVRSFKSQRSLLIGSVYCPPSFSKAEDLSLEINIEQIYLLNKEIILLKRTIQQYNNDLFHSTP